ncbi:hypothetical protein K439DRAFT_659412 [Ramaria rubella]|nr:hypothetical protein K439DRAFT_659412 [Ramaria rubella]
MPLIVHEGQLPTTGRTFMIFYSSKVEGIMWCPDCRNVEDFVQRTFDASPETGIIIYVGAESTMENF